MNALDAWILRQVQRLVDLSGRTVRWWLEVCAMITLVVGLPHAMAQSDFDVWGLILVIARCINGTVMHFAGRDASIRHVLDFGAWRVLWVSWTIGRFTGALFLALFDHPAAVLTWISIALETVMDFALYFVACKDPPPPRKRHSFNLARSSS